MRACFFNSLYGFALRACLCAAFFCCAFLLPAELFKNNRQLSVIQTTYFDFIFPPESEESARILASSADALYARIASQLDTVPKIRLPVVLTPDTQMLNAYYSPYPYNRIVVYDTPPSEGSLVSYADSLVSVFAHELTHAVSINIKSPFWTGMSAVFGDVLSPAVALNLPTSFIEGVTVSFESKENLFYESTVPGGRLNDAWVMQLLVQAKLENKFPSWRDVAGARDIYPSGTPPYLFGGAFAAWIQQKYGMAKYAEFWHASGRVNFFALTAGIFKKVYGVKLDHEWQAFKDSVSLPIVDDSDRTPIGSANQGRYFSLVSSQLSLAWIDTIRSGVYFLGAAQKKERRLFTVSEYAEKIAFSTDGKYLAVTAWESEPGTGLLRSVGRVFDIERREFTSDVFAGMRETTLITLPDGRLCAAGVETRSQFVSLVVFPLQSKNKNGVSVKNTEPLFKIDFPRNTNAFSLSDGGNGRLVFIASEQGRRSLGLVNLADGSVLRAVVPLPVGSQLKEFAPQLSKADADTLSVLFSWTEPDALSRLGELVIDFADSVVYSRLSFATVSGGKQNPVPLNAKTAYISRFFDHDRLFYDEFPNFEPYGNAPLETGVFSQLPPVDLFEKNGGTLTDPESFTVSPYIPVSYFRNGILLPVYAGIASVTDPEDWQSLIIPGISWLTGDPAEKHFLTLGAGYAPFFEEFRFMTNYVNTATPVTIIAEAEARVPLSLQTTLSAALSAKYLLFLRNPNQYWSFIDKLSWLTNLSEHQVVNQFETSFTSTRRTGFEYYERLGFTVGLGNATQFLVLQQSLRTVFYLFGNVYAPCLLPVRNPRSFTVNLPFTLGAEVNLDFFRINSRLVLFAYEIQRGIPALPLYVKRISVFAGNTGDFSWKGVVGTQVVYGEVQLTFSPIIGALTRISFDVGCRVNYTVLNNSWNVNFAGGIRY